MLFWNTHLSKLRTKVNTCFRRYPLFAIAIFARTPLPGKTKTRLIPLLGARGAADFQAALLWDTLRKVNAYRGDVARYLFIAGKGLRGSSPTPSRGGLANDPGRTAGPYLGQFSVARQRGADLGARLQSAFRSLLRRHVRVVVIGTDSPLLPLRILREALGELRICDAVLGPSLDGGYYLVGLRRLSRGLFRGIRWGSSHAFQDTLCNLLGPGYSCSVLEVGEDVDRPEDVRRLTKELARSRAARRLAPAVWRFLTGFHAVKWGRTACAPSDSSIAFLRPSRRGDPWARGRSALP